MRIRRPLARNLPQSASLRALVDSDDYRDRLKGGRILRSVLEPANGFVDRTIEHIELLGPNSCRRRLEFEVRPDRLAGIESSSGVVLDTLPIALVAKTLFHDVAFVDSNGLPGQLVTRRENARLAQSHLVAVAVDSSPGVGEPSARMWAYLGECVGRFPEEDAKTLKFRTRAERHLKRLDVAADRAWLRRAIAVPGWPKLLANYEDGFLMTPRRAPSVGDPVANYVYEYEEPRAVVGPVLLRTKLSRSEAGRRAFAFRINEIGRARSHYVHLHAPQGTFWGRAAFERLNDEDDYFLHRTNTSLRVWTAYIRRRSVPRSRSVTVLATLWPEPGGFIRPLRLVGRYTVFVAACFLFMRWPDAPSARFSDQLDGSISLLLFLPALIIGWLFRTDEGKLRGALTTSWRAVGACCIAIIWVNLSMAFFNLAPDSWLGRAVTATYAANLFFACFFLSAINRYRRHLRSAYWITSDLETKPSRTEGAFVLKAALPPMPAGSGR